MSKATHKRAVKLTPRQLTTIVWALWRSCNEIENDKIEKWLKNNSQEQHRDTDMDDIVEYLYERYHERKASNPAREKPSIRFEFGSKSLITAMQCLINQRITRPRRLDIAHWLDDRAEEPGTLNDISVEVLCLQLTKIERRR